MTTHLEKAKGALDGAREAENLPDGRDQFTYAKCLDLAQVQAAVAQAEALTRIADVLEEETKQGGFFNALIVSINRIADLS